MSAIWGQAKTTGLVAWLSVLIGKASYIPGAIYATIAPIWDEDQLSHSASTPEIDSRPESVRCFESHARRLSQGSDSLGSEPGTQNCFNEAEKNG
jgi:hypothetical protein